MADCRITVARFCPPFIRGRLSGRPKYRSPRPRVSNLVNKQLKPGLQQKQLRTDPITQQATFARNGTVDQRIEGLIASYELAFRMQSTMPQIMDLNDESQDNARPLRRRLGTDG